LTDLLQKLLEKIRANHPAIRTLIVSWITFLDSIPQIKMINRIYDFLPGLFNMLCDKYKDVNQSADKCLKDFLFEIEEIFENLDKETTNKILEIIIEQCKTMQDASKLMAFDWLLKFLKKYNSLLNTLSFKNIRYHNKYYKKLVNSKDRFSNIVNIKRNINLAENKIEKKLFTQSFNEQMGGKSSYFNNDKLFGADENKSNIRDRTSNAVLPNKNFKNENECVSFYNTYNGKKQDTISNENENENQISFKRIENYRNSSDTYLQNNKILSIYFIIYFR